MEGRYIFKSERLGFRNWIPSDIEKMILINNDQEVMKYFPALPSKEQTIEFVDRMQKEYAKKNYCYFALDELESKRFIGFIGLCDQTYESDFTPCTDIGWRLCRSFWYKGFATEGAKACLDFANKHLKLPQIYAVSPSINKNSIKVMENIGMSFVKNFDHPGLKYHASLKNCVLYSYKKEYNEPPVR